MSSGTGSCNNLELPSPTLNHNTKPQIPLKFDHNQLWTQLPHLDSPKLANTARTTPPDFSKRIDTVFFKRHVDDWKARIKTQIKEALAENPTGQALADLIHKEQKFWQKRSDGYRIKLGKHADVQAKRKEHGIKHKTLY